MKYNNNWLIAEMKKNADIHFFHFWGHQPSKDGTITKSCFSQWWVAPFDADGTTYQTAEHWMMAGKARLFDDHDTLKEILNADTPNEAKQLGRKVSGFDPAIWDKEKFDLVVKGNLHKFSFHPALKDFLLKTENSVLVEASPLDRIWGIGMGASNADANDPRKWKGQNLLGYALMEVRDVLKEK